jgi:uncharacterized membrane protein
VISIVLAGLTAVVWGAADYSGGRATRGGPALSVTVAAQILGLPVVLLSLILVPGTAHATDLAWGAAAGLAGAAGTVLLYQGLSTGAMAIVAPVTAVTAALVPMVVGLITDVSPGWTAGLGALCAVAAIGMVSLSPQNAAAGVARRAVTLALAAGAMFGLFLTLLAQASRESGMWAVAAGRTASIGLGLVIVAVLVRRGGAIRLPRSILPWLIGAGAGDVAANALYLLAARDGLLSVVGPIASLYPVSTVLLALFVDHERVRPVQVVGLGLAAAALVLAAV